MIKKSRFVGVRMNQNLYDQLIAYAEKNKISNGEVLREALKKHIKYKGKVYYD